MLAAMTRRSCRLRELSLALALLFATPAVAILQQDEAAPVPSQAPSLEERRSRADEELRRTRSALDAGAGQLPEAVLRLLEERARLLERLGVVLAQVRVEQERLTDLDEELAAVANRRAALGAGSPEGPPPSLPELDVLRAERSAQRARQAAATRAVEAARAALGPAKEAAAEAERRRARLRQELTDARGGSLEAVAEARLATAAVQARVARARLELQQSELRTREKAARLEEARARLAAERIDQAESRVVFTPAQLERVLEDLASRTSELGREVEKAREALPAAEQEWQQARVALESGGAPVDAALLEAERARKHDLERLRRRARLLADRQGRLGERSEAWRRRHAILTGGATDAERASWATEAREQLEAIDGSAAAGAADLAALRQRRDAASTRVAELEADGATPRRVLRDARHVRDVVNSLIELTEEDLSSLEEDRELLRAISRELQEREGGTAWLAVAWTKSQTALRAAWDFELATINERLITIGGIVKGLLLLIVGLLVVRLVTRRLAHVLTSRVRFDEGAAATLEALAFYLLAALIALLALDVANVPLTAFTIVGGAIAIGVGFGTQNLMNNFISGLILLVERPVRVGDLIELRGGTMGLIHRIGPRSTKVRTGEGVDILVPNSSFLETEVVNWTLSDSRVRRSVVLGVAYGSPTRDVARILKKAAVEHGRVLDKPEPFVLFEDFGDSALLFEVQFWIRMRRPMDGRLIQSDLRFMIDGMLREAGITIAFPQRDVHLDGTAPLSVRLVDGLAAPRQDDAPPSSD